MNEKLPLLHQAIQELKNKQATEHLANELTTLVEKLSAQLEKKELAAVQTTEEKITKFLAEHEKEITIGDWQTELATLKWTIQPKNNKPSSRWSRLRGTDNKATSTEEEAPEEKIPRRERRGKKLAWRGAAIWWILLVLKWRTKTQLHPTTMKPRASDISPLQKSVQDHPKHTWVAYEQASLEQKRTMCYQYLQQIWFSKILAAWIVGNIQQESKFDTKAIGDNGTSYWSCQRHNDPKNTKNRRRTNLKNYHRTYGAWRPISDYTLQLDFIK